MSVVSIIVLGCGICLLFIPIRMLYWGIAPKYWKKTEGELHDIFAEERNNKGITFYIIHVKYQYNVNGITFTGNKLSSNRYSYSSTYSSQAIISKLKSLPYLPVFYNPKTPKQSIIIPGIDSFTIMILILVLVANIIILFGIYIKS